MTQVERAPCSLRFVGDTDVSGMKKSQVAQVIGQYQENIKATKGPFRASPPPRTVWPASLFETLLSPPMCKTPNP